MCSLKATLRLLRLAIVALHSTPPLTAVADIDSFGSSDDERDDCKRRRSLIIDPEFRWSGHSVESRDSVFC